MGVSAARARLTPEDVERLVKGATGDDRAAAARKICVKVDDARLTDAERAAAREVLAFMAADAAVIVRRTLATTLRNSPRLPRDLALKLAADLDEVAAPLIEESPVLTDDDLAALVRAGSTRKQVAVASRIEITTPVVRVVVGEAGEEAVARIARNDGAEFDQTSFDTALERFGDRPGVVDAFIDRAVLPAAVSARLVALATEKALARLARRHALPPQLAVELADGTRERGIIDVLDQAGCAADVRRFVQQLQLNGLLTPSLVLRGLCQGHMKFFEHAIAELSGVPPEKAWVLIHDAGPLGLRAIFERAGLPSRIYAAARFAIETYHELEHDGRPDDRVRISALMIERLLTRTAGLAREDEDYLLEKLDALGAETVRDAERLRAA
jgi:uncharacterized protein (DUF2336 family)